MRRVTRQKAAILWYFSALFCSQIASQPASAASTLREPLSVIEMLGVHVAEIGSFDDAALRDRCQTEAEGPLTYFIVEGWRGSARLDQSGLVATSVVLQSSGTSEVICIEEVSLGKLEYEEDALTAGDLSIRNLHSPDRAGISTYAGLSFTYDWKTIESKWGANLHVQSGGQEIGHARVEAELDGIDFIDLQDRTATSTGFSDILAAGIHRLEIEFVDRGIIEAAILETSKISGQTPGELRRQYYTVLEQYRSVFDRDNLTLIGQTLSLLENLIVDGGGGRIEIKASRLIRFIELLDENTLPEVISDLNFTAVRIP